MNLKKSDEIKEAIIKDREDAMTLNEIAYKYGITMETLRNWQREDPVFDKKMSEARVKSTEVLEDKLLTVADGANSIAAAAVARVKSDNIKSVLGYRKPEVYGNKLNVEHNHVVDISKALKAAEARLSNVIDVNTRPLSNSATALNASDIVDVTTSETLEAEKVPVKKVEDLF